MQKYVNSVNAVDDARDLFFFFFICVVVYLVVNLNSLLNIYIYELSEMSIFMLICVPHHKFMCKASKLYVNNVRTTDPTL